MATSTLIKEGRTSPEEMYDLLVEKCDALELLSHDCPRCGPGKLTPLMLAAKLGRKKLFKHILFKRTLPVWLWGPEAEYKIPVDEIDSAESKGESGQELNCLTDGLMVLL